MTCHVSPLNIKLVQFFDDQNFLNIFYLVLFNSSKNSKDSESFSISKFSIKQLYVTNKAHNLLCATKTGGRISATIATP